MTLDEIGEDLEGQFGKPVNVTEQNIRFALSLAAERVKDGKVDEEVPVPSVDALAMTIIAVMSYQNVPWEELAKKPAIKRTLTYIVVRGKDHYEDVEALVRQLFHKHTKGLTHTMCLQFLKLTKTLSCESRPSRFIDCMNFPAQYDNIRDGLHKLIKSGQNDRAALILTCAIEDGILCPLENRSVFIDEFLLTKSGFNKAFTQYHDEYDCMDKTNKAVIDSRKTLLKTTLRATIGYNLIDSQVKFFSSRLKRRNFFTTIFAYLRSVFRN